MKSCINSVIAYVMLVITTLSSCGVNVFVHHCCSLQSYVSAFVEPDWHASELASEECSHDIEGCSHDHNMDEHSHDSCNHNHSSESSSVEASDNCAQSRVSHHHHHCSNPEICSETGIEKCGCENRVAEPTDRLTNSSSNASITSLNNEHFYIAMSVVSVVNSSNFECKPLSTTLLSSVSVEQQLSIKDVDSTELFINNISSQVTLTSLERVCLFNRLKIPESISIV